MSEKTLKFIDFYVDKNPQVYLEQCKYKEKKEATR